MSKRSSRARRDAWQDARCSSDQRRAAARTARFDSLANRSRMAWSDRHAARCDSGELPEMRQGVMHSGYSPNTVYSRRNGGAVTELSAVSDRVLYGDRVADYRAMRDAAKIAKRQEARALARALAVERALAEAERRRREGNGWA